MVDDDDGRSSIEVERCSAHSDTDVMSIILVLVFSSTPGSEGRADLKISDERSEREES